MKTTGPPVWKNLGFYHQAEVVTGTLLPKTTVGMKRPVLGWCSLNQKASYCSFNSSKQHKMIVDLGWTWVDKARDESFNMLLPSQKLFWMRIFTPVTPKKMSNNWGNKPHGPDWFHSPPKHDLLRKLTPLLLILLLHGCLEFTTDTVRPSSIAFAPRSPRVRPSSPSLSSLSGRSTFLPGLGSPPGSVWNVVHVDVTICQDHQISHEW